MFSYSLTFPPARRRAKVVVSGLFLALAASAAVPAARAQSGQDPVYVFQTNLGNMRVQLFPDVTPKTVSNFLSYVNSGAYNSSFIHRSVSNFVIQGGGFTVDASANISAIPTNAPVTGEAHISNTRGTIAMALSTGPNSGTDQWYFNEADNSASLDGTSSGGPFTVFGRILDRSGLATMDRIGALPVYDARQAYNNGALMSLPLEDYNSSQYVQYSNFVVIQSITQTSAWAAESVSTGADGYTRILWDKADGTASVWKVDASGNLVTQQQFGPYTGWTAQAIATGKDNQTRLLWTNTNGTAAYYLLDANNVFVSQQQYGPYSGWTAQGLAVAPDNSGRALWTNSNGTATVWTLDATNHLKTQQQYGPYPNSQSPTWIARSLAVNPDGTERLLWTNTDGTAAFWKLNSSSQLTSQQQYGPYTDYSAQAIVSAPDGTGRVVWTANDTHIALWSIDANNAYTAQTQYGPFSGWAFQSLSVGADGNARLLWDNVSGQSALWSLTSSGGFAANTQYGPY